MKSNLEIQTVQWPYGIQIEVVDGGLLLRPKRKAREGWAEQFEKASLAAEPPDDLADFRSMPSEFDEKEWEW